mmetsp:Transcript_15318/g.44302  ORF Transcript_15318/g.44302 Transcript_15318/m.44302 type:complete len:474 (+) Transcript_15318:144-1565(+)|eukprot:CAMPEP_0176059392 /NCGR_PEP_ID=MMETSP0120_2-20121206/29598_1 /TAXON_ID=160619 /ORGANISM="Kryptoperidinium foliaceum, Strain CCMP 1326" /LENGTH=473 /DNA_ID=CAMNT_0017392929 /DNA_START=144 /DNA_END=1565 /DNA_ORIENTATION=+
MSWRAESTFKPSSKLVDEEKEFLKLVKKVRDIVKLEEKAAKGEALETLQQEKVASKEKVLKEVAAAAVKLPGETELFEKNADVIDLLPSGTLKAFEKKKQQDQQQRDRRARQDMEKREKVEFMTHHEKPIVDIALSSDGKHLFTCSKDKYVLCWSMKDRLLQVVATYAGHKGAVFAVDAGVGPYGLVSGGADGEVHFWQADTSKLRTGDIASPSAKLSHGGIVRVLRWCPFDAPDCKERRLASASEKLVSSPPAICVWRVGDRGKAECIVRIDDPKVLPGKANDLRWGGGAMVKLFSCHDNGYVGVWNPVSAEPLLRTCKLHSAPIMSLALAADGSQIVTASHDQTCAAVDVTTREMPKLMVYKANRPLNAVCLSADFKAGAGGAGTLVLAGGKNAREVTTEATLEDEFESKMLDAATGEEAGSTTKAHFGPVHRLLSLPAVGKGGAFGSVSEDGTLKVHGLDGRTLHSDVIE